MTTPIATSVCRYCRSAIDPAAHRCPHCTSWLGRRHLTGAAGSLKFWGVVWIIVSVIAALGFVGWALMQNGASSMVGYLLAFVVLTQGSLMGCAAMVLAERSEPDPKPFSTAAGAEERG